MAFCPVRRLPDPYRRHLRVNISPLRASSFSYFRLLTAVSSIAAGSYTVLVAPAVMAFGETADVGRRIGMSMTIVAFGALIGPPISGAINSASGGFEAVGFYAGKYPQQC